MGRSSVSNHLIDRAVHAALVGIVLVNVGFMVSCALDDGKDLGQDGVTSTRQAVVVGTSSDVGTLPGDFSVAPSGTGRYVVRLWAPQGRAGMTPELALGYSSGGNGDGHIGVGWSLSGGMSMIHRCVKNSRRHTRPEPISFVNSASEKYCLDGQPLVLVSGSNGEVGAEYRTEPDTFAKVTIDQVQDGQPVRFTAFSRDGRIHAYGTSASQGAFDDESLLVRGNRDQWGLAASPNRDDASVENIPSSSAIYGWLRGSVRDRFAFPNHIWFKYNHPSDRTSPGAAQEPLLDAIEYVDVGGFRTRQLKFAYGPMPHVDSQRHEYIAGMPFKTTKRLQSIDMQVAAPGSTLRSVKFYKLTHGTSPTTSRMRLDSIEECDGNQPFVTGRTVVCKKATTFSYSPGSSTFSDVATGIADLRQAADSAFWGIQVADIDHDGRDDILYRATPPGGGPRRWYHRNAVAGGFGPAIDMGLQVNDVPGDAVLADFARADGVQGIDGAPDIGVPAGPNRYAFYRNDGLGNFTHLFTEPEGEAAPNLGLQVADLSGKGQVTILRPISSQNNWAYRFFTGAAMTPLSGPMGCLWNDAFNQEGWNGQTGDVDGDGATDFLTIRAGATDYLSRMLQLAVPAPPPVQGEPPPGEGSPGQVWDYDDTNLLASKAGDLVKHYFFDFNGDGLPDAFRLRQGQSVPRLVVNSGSGFATPQALSGLGVSGNVELGTTTAVQDIIDPGIRIIDFDSDGKQDVLLIDSGIKRDSAAQPTSTTRTNAIVLLSRNGTLQPTVVADVPVGQPADGHAAIDPSWSLIHNYRQTQVLDVNGDGLQDIVAVSPADNQLHLYLRQGQRPDLLVRVRDGMGSKTDVSYLPMIDPSVYTPGPLCSFPQVCAKRGPWLVRSFQTDNGVGPAQNEFRFSYEGNVIDVQGAGSLGFRRWVQTDVAASTTIDEVFDQDSTATVRSLDDGAPDVQVYSKLGLPTVRIVETSDPAFIRRMIVDRSYEFIATNDRRSYYARPTMTGIIEDEASPPGTPGVLLSSRTQTFAYESQFDDFGIVSGMTSSSFTSQGEFVDEWSSTYQNDSSAWLLGLMTEAITKSRAPNEAEVVRKTRFQPDPNSGALNSLETEPDDVTNDMYLFVEFVRNPFGQLWIYRRTDHLANQRTDTILYDPQSVHPRTHTNSLNHVTTFDADPGLGVLNSVRDPNDVSTTHDYDAFGRILRVNYPGGGGRTLTYERVPDPHSTAEDPRDQLKVTSSEDGGGQVIRFVNRVAQEKRRERKNLDGSLSFASFDYNDLGLLAGSSRPALIGQPAGATTVRSFDELGRVTREDRPEDSVDEDGNPATAGVSTVSYDKLVSTISDEFGRLTRVTGDGIGRVIRSESKNDSGQWLPMEYTYGPFNVLRFVVRQDGSGGQSRTTEAVYDRLGRRTSMADPDTGTRGFAYNAFGEVRHETDAAGSSTTYTRDNLGRVTQKVDKDGTTTFTWDSAANGKGKLAEANSPSGVRRQFFYDTFGRMNREIWTMTGQSFQLDYTFDTSGRLHKVSYPSTTGFTRLTVANAYDPDSGELSKVQRDGTSTVYWELNTTEVDGQIKRETFGNAVRTDYGYSTITGRIHNITTTKGTSTLRDWSYGYWSDGNLRQRSDLKTSEHERFEYDELDRIKRWLAADSVGNPMSGGWAVNYTIDDFGNLTRRHFVAGSATGGTSQDLGFTLFPGTNRVQTSPWGSYGYDANGNQTTRPDGETVTYSAFDLPKQMTGPRAATFLYDAFGTRAKKRKDDTHYTLYVSDLYEKRLDGSTVDHVMYVLARGKVVAQVMRRQGGSESVRYLHGDRLGSVDAVTDSAGTVVEQTKRDPFGNRVANFNTPALPSTISGSSNKVRLGFTGHEQDDELGLINMRGRMYDARLGRFLTADPMVSRILNGQAYNRYAYVLNNPTRYVDPTGFEIDDPCQLDPNGTDCAEKRRKEKEEEEKRKRAESDSDCVEGQNAVSCTQKAPASPGNGMHPTAGEGVRVGDPPGGGSTGRGGGRTGAGGTSGSVGPSGSGTTEDPAGMAAAATTMVAPRPLAPLAPVAPAAPGFLARLGAGAVALLSAPVIAVAIAVAIVFTPSKLGDPQALSTREGLRAEAKGEKGTTIRDVEIIPGKGAQVGDEMSEADAIEVIRAGGDVAVKGDRSVADRIIEEAGGGKGEYDPAHREGENEHRHRRGPNEGEGRENTRGPGHVIR